MKLWYNPVPSPTKYNVLHALCVVAVPTNTPVDPTPTLTVEIPIKSFEILATNKLCPSVSVVAVPIVASSFTTRPSPLPFL